MAKKWLSKVVAGQSLIRLLGINSLDKLYIVNGIAIRMWNNEDGRIYPDVISSVGVSNFNYVARVWAKYEYESIPHTIELAWQAFVRGEGFVRRALPTILEDMLEKYKCVFALIDKDNKASLKCAELSGFKAYRMPPRAKYCNLYFGELPKKLKRYKY